MSGRTEPYSDAERRIADYFSKHEVGAGPDPVGALIEAHKIAMEQRQKLAVENAALREALVAEKARSARERLYVPSVQATVNVVPMEERRDARQTAYEQQRAQRRAVVHDRGGQER